MLLFRIKRSQQHSIRPRTGLIIFPFSLILQHQHQAETVSLRVILIRLGTKIPKTIKNDYQNANIHFFPYGFPLSPQAGRDSSEYTVSLHHFSLQRYEEAAQHQGTSYRIGEKISGSLPQIANTIWVFLNFILDIPWFMTLVPLPDIPARKMAKTV